MVWDAEVKAAAAHWAKTYGVTIDPGLVHAIIERESGHGQAPNYVSHRGIVPEPGGHTSYGPMQIYDDTVKTLGIGFEPDGLASHPQLGIWYGTKYLATLLQRFKGDVARAVSGYNAGPGNANRSAAGTFPNQPYVDFVLSFLKRNAQPMAAALPALLLAGAVVWMMISRRAPRAA